MQRAPLLHPTQPAPAPWGPSGRVEGGGRWVRSQPRGPLDRWPGLRGSFQSSTQGQPVIHDPSDPGGSSERAHMGGGCWCGAAPPRELVPFCARGCCLLAKPAGRALHPNSKRCPVSPGHPPVGTLPHARRCPATGSAACLPCLLSTPPRSNGTHFIVKFPKLPKALKIRSFSNHLFGSNTWLHQTGSCLQPSCSSNQA